MVPQWVGKAAAYSTSSDRNSLGIAVTTCRLVLDTNVVLDWLIYQDARIAFLTGLLDAGRISLASEARCLAELEDVLQRPVIRATKEARIDALSRYGKTVEMFESRLLPHLPQCRDADDQAFIELAVTCGAFALVTRDKELLRMHHTMMRLCHLQVVQPADLERLLEV